MDVLAVSAETTNALIAASAALGGAIVGGVITTGATWWLERRRDAADLREARRLVAEEVGMTYFVLNALLQDKAYPPSRADPNVSFFPTEQWEQHRNALARHLNDKEWRVIASSMDGFRIAEVTTAREKPGPIPPSELESMKVGRDLAAECYEILTGGTKIEDLIPRTPDEPVFRD